MLWPKKNPPRNLITKKNSGSSKIPLPRHNFSKGPSLNRAGGAGGRLKPNQKKGAKIKGGKFSRLPRCLFILHSSVEMNEKVQSLY